MSDADTKKRRPPKLSPICQEPVVGGLQADDCATNSSAPSSFEDDCDLESSVKVKLDTNNETILIKPDNINVLQQLGRGQYGIVEKVYHEPSGNQFAVKRVPLEPGDENERRRLLMDVDILVKGTECKNIIKFYGALIWEGDLWIFMELMDCSLDRFYRLIYANSKFSQYLQTNQQQTLVCDHVGSQQQLGNCSICNPLPERVLGKIALDVVNALSYLYSIKVIHRDIKPSNILINDLGIVKLCDFGISGYLVDSVAKTYDAGCRPYMAPERIDPPRDRTGYDIKSDVWSFGITMLEIATGKYPYHQARDFFEQLKMICANEPPQLPTGRFSTHFVDFVNQCLRRDYKTRPKYESLEKHPFIVNYRNEDIATFTKLVLQSAALE